MSDKIVQLNEHFIKTELKELVRQSVDEVLNGLLDEVTSPGVVFLTEPSKDVIEVRMPGVDSRNAPKRTIGFKRMVCR